MVLVCSLFVFLSFYVIFPSSHGYGSDYGTTFLDATARAEGVHYEEIWAGNETVNYKFYANIEANVTLDIAFNMSDFNLSLYIFANQSKINGMVDYSNATGNDYQNCSIRINLTGYYLVNVSSLNYTVNWNFTMNLTIVGGRVIFSPWIPGFEVVYMVFGLVISAGIILWFRNHKKRNYINIRDFS